MNNDQVASVLEEIGVLLELQGENPFKTRAYANAARTVLALNEPLGRILAEGRLGGIQGIGEALQKKITELVATGRLAYHEELVAATPPGLLALLDLPGLGPKRIKVLHDQLGVDSVEKLEAACQDGRVAALRGFGEKTAANLRDGIARRRTYASRFLLWRAQPVAERLLEELRAHPEVIRCSLAGSLRRGREVIGDIDLLASSKHPAEVLEDFVRWPEIQSIIARGGTKASVLLAEGWQCDLRVVSDAEFPFALAYFTGSKEHNIVLRQRAIARGLRLNEYGLFRSAEETRDPRLLVPCRTEEEIYERLGLAYVPPELREDLGEFEAAARGPLPRLIEWTDLKGSLHNHSTWSDGRQAPRDIARAMAELGLAYWAITDHSKSQVQANGLDEARLRRQLEEIAAINTELERDGHAFRLLTGMEVDILKDGRLDLPETVLRELDVVVASAHQRFAQTEAELTERLITAARHPCVHILGHLTGRLLLEREPYPVDQKAVIDACAETGVWIELNASPSRLDMDWRLWPYAREKGVKCVINCDAHRPEHAAYLRLGATVARKGGLTREDVANTWPLAKLRRELRRRRGTLP